MSTRNIQFVRSLPRFVGTGFVALLALGAFAVSGTPVASAAPPEVHFTYETGGAAILQNDGRYGANGTAFDAEITGQSRNLLIAQRANVELGLGRHRVVLLYAPFAATTRVRLADALTFNDTTFAAGTVVDHGYLFDGYRASYMYEVIKCELELALGGSIQIRNADVAFTAVDGSGYANESDIGIVFALKARLRYAPEDWPVWGQLEADAFSTFGLIDGVDGGIYDVGLTLGVPVARPLDLLFTTRLVGGGAKVEDKDIDNWANFFSLALGARVKLDEIW